MPVQTPTLNPFEVVAAPAPAQMTPTTAGDAAQMQASTVNTSALAQPTAETAENRLTGILNKGGPLMQQAATAGQQQAASRGLLNSSMAVQAAQAATYQAATPIATADANSINQMAGQNASQFNNTLQSNANAQNTAAQTNMSATNQANQFNANTQNQASQWNASTQNEFAKLNTQNQNTANQWNAQQGNEATLKTLDINSREQLANIEANYKQLMQTNSSAENMYSQVMKNISDIQNNKDISDKTTAIESQMSWLRSGLTMIQNLNGVSGLVTF